MAYLRLVVHAKVASVPALRDAVAYVRHRGHQVDVRVTWEAHDAFQFAKEAAFHDVERIVAVGGDGTINEVVSGLVASQKHCSLAVVPMGTANDFATALQIPREPLHDALVLAAEGLARWVDVGIVNHDRCFINMATGGFGAEVTTDTPTELKKTLGGLAYILSGIIHAATLTPIVIDVSGPSVHWSGEILAFAVGNYKQAGGGILLCPQAKLDDGLLDVVLIPKVDTSNAFDWLSGLLWQSSEAFLEHVTYIQLPSLEISAEREMQVNIDGEPMRNKRFVFETKRKALKLVAPWELLQLNSYPDE